MISTFSRLITSCSGVVESSAIAIPGFNRHIIAPAMHHLIDMTGDQASRDRTDETH